MNPFEDGSHLLPLLVRHPRQAGLPTDPGVDDHGPIREHGPQSTAAGRNGSHDGCNSLIVEIARNQTSWFVERSRRDFEQIGSSLLAHRTIHPGAVIMSQGKKLKRDGAQTILVLQIGLKVFLCNPRWLTHSSAGPILSFPSVFFIQSRSVRRPSRLFALHLLPFNRLVTFFVTMRRRFSSILGKVHDSQEGK